MTDLAAAVACLRAGNLVGMPTETVYGLAGDARNPLAIEKIFALKQRPRSHPLIVHLADQSWLSRWARDVPDLALEMAERYWPGPLTLVLKRAPSVLSALTGGQDTIALRVPRHPIALDLLRAFGDGLVAPSANRYQHVSPTTAAHVQSEFGDALPMVLDGGPCEIGIESSIVDLSAAQPRILRLGSLLREEFGAHVAASDIRVPGSDPRHYAPAHPAELIDAADWPARLAHWDGAGVRYAALSWQNAAGAHTAIAANPDPTAYAQALYRDLRQLGAASVERILIERPPATSVWAAVLDRLRRACA